MGTTHLMSSTVTLASTFRVNLASAFARPRRAAPIHTRSRWNPMSRRADRGEPLASGFPELRRALPSSFANCQTSRNSSLGRGRRCAK